MGHTVFASKVDTILHLTLGRLVNVSTQLRSNHLQQLADCSRLEWEVVIFALDLMLLVHVITISKQKKRPNASEMLSMAI